MHREQFHGGSFGNDLWSVQDFTISHFFTAAKSKCIQHHLQQFQIFLYRERFLNPTTDSSCSTPLEISLLVVHSQYFVLSKLEVCPSVSAAGLFGESLKIHWRRPIHASVRTQLKLPRWATDESSEITGAQALYHLTRLNNHNISILY